MRTQTFLIADGTVFFGFLASAAAIATISDPTAMGEGQRRGLYRL